MTNDVDALDYRAPEGGDYGTNGTFYLGGQFMHRTGGGGTRYGAQAAEKAKAELTAQVAPQVSALYLSWLAEDVANAEATVVFLAAWALYVERIDADTKTAPGPSQPESVTAGAIAKRAALPLAVTQAALDAMVAARFVELCKPHVRWGQREKPPYYLVTCYRWTDAEVRAMVEED